MKCTQMTQDTANHTGLRNTIAALLSGSSAFDYDYGTTPASNARTQASTLDFELENFLVCGVVGFIAVLIAVLVVALAVLLFVNTGSRRTNTLPERDLEKQTPARLATIPESEEESESESE